MARRSYGQFCGLASSLDILGERWSLLVVRELLLGPRRYKDLLANLPGIGTGLLAARLKHLERSGIVRRTTLPPPAGTPVYELTEAGRELEAVLFALSRWGLKWTLDEMSPDDEYRPAWAVLSMRATFRPEEAEGVNETYEFRVDGEVFHARVKDGSVETRQGPAWEPDLVVTADPKAFLAVAIGQIEPDEIGPGKSIEIEGDQQTALRCMKIFGLPLKGRRRVTVSS